MDFLQSFSKHLITSDIKFLCEWFFNKISMRAILLSCQNSNNSSSHFRPISLCNYTYKIISKVLVNRMKPIMSQLIYEVQGTFVSNRLILDNIFTAREMYHYLKKKKKGKKCFFFLRQLWKRRMIILNELSWKLF